MKLPRASRFAFLLCLFLPLLALAQPLAGLRFAHEASDLKADPAVTFGQLPNGLRYALLKNTEPRGRASLRLLVAAGSLHETDAQRGLAHFLEHMAFNGSTHYAPGTLVEFFQRMGMSFGGDTNAYTSFDHTAYMLELPDTKLETLAEGLRVFSDYAGGLLLLDAEIDKERGIILNEKRARDSVEFRQFLAEFDFLLGTTRLPARIPIGLPEIISKAPRAEFADFYDTWYRPERLAFIAVGDFDPAALEKQVRETFAALAARAPARAIPDVGSLPAFQANRAKHHHEPEAAATQVSIQTLTILPPQPDTAAQRLVDLPRSLAVAMINRRLEILAKQENAPFSNGSVGINDGFEFYRSAGIELNCKPEQWAAALTVAENELRRALTHGFQPSELKEAVANLRNALEQSVKSAPTRRSPGLASALISSLIQGEVFTTPTDDLALFAPALDQVTVERALDSLRAAFANPHRNLTVFGNAKLTEPDPAAAILAVYEKAAQQLVAAPAAEKEQSFAYTDFGPAGTIAQRAHIADLDLTLATLSNHVRVNVKKTDFQAGKIQLSLRIGTGQLTEPADQPALGLYASSTFTAGGLGQHSTDDLEKILAGKNVGTGFRVSDDALVFNATTTPDDLLLQLQLLAAHLTDPGYRPEADRQIQKLISQFYMRLAHSPTGPLQTEIPRLLADNDARFGIPPQEILTARSLADARAWLTPQLKTGAIELALVGELDVDQTLAAVAQTLGALPSRETKPNLDAARQARFPKEILDRTFRVDTEIPKGTVALYWPTCDASDIQRTRRLRLLADVFSDRLRIKIREELGESYSPRAGSAPSDTYRDYGFLFTTLTVDPAKADLVEKVTLALADDLATGNITADELNRIRLPALTAMKEAERTNSYWLGAVLSQAQEQPQRLDWSRTRLTDLEAVTTDELNALAKTYLLSTRAHRFQLLPVEKSAPAKP